MYHSYFMLREKNELNDESQPQGKLTFHPYTLWEVVFHAAYLFIVVEHQCEGGGGNS